MGDRQQVAGVGEVRRGHRGLGHVAGRQAELGEEALVQRGSTLIAPAACWANIAIASSSGARAEQTLNAGA
ncbi:MAG: hypothetical protein M3N52_03495 [Actinomycetota bacterium]|nr:hypothetical protein [Actinomycetota bacterium]